MSQFPETALVTGGEGGIGRAIRAVLEAEGCAVRSLDLLNGFDVTDPAAWDAVEAVDLACLNAGILTASPDVFELTPDEFRQAVAVNVGGVVLGVRALGRVMEPGSTIVATASLAGLIPMESDPVYSLTKHAVVGFVRSVAPALAERGITINLVCPGIADTPMADSVRDALAEAGFPLIEPARVAEAVLMAARSGETGKAWAIQPGRDPVDFRFPNVPGPRAEGAEGVTPPIAR
jgi:NAD(P)-dependent dehydrogenase (short-subunit alcohol dehydrogenase family)